MDYPHCYQDKESFDVERRLCKTCPWLYVCGTHLGHEFNVTRKEFIRYSLINGVPDADKDFVAAVARHVHTTLHAARLAIRYARRTLRS